MFKQEERRSDEVATVIGPSVTVEGNFVANGDIIIEGTVSGSIKTEQNLQVGPNAKIFANVQAANAVIAGEVQGNLKIKGSLELGASAKIFGDVKTDLLSIEGGAALHGKCQAGASRKAKLEKPDEKAFAEEAPQPEETPAKSKSATNKK